MGENTQGGGDLAEWAVQDRPFLLQCKGFEEKSPYFKGIIESCDAKGCPISGAIPIELCQTLYVGIEVSRQYFDDRGLVAPEMISSADVSILFVWLQE